MKKRWLVFAAYLVLTLIFYHKALQVYFLSDDWKLFYLLNRYGFSAITSNFGSEFIRIIPCLTLSVLCFLFRISSAVPFHVFSILLHALNSFLVFVLAGKIFGKYLEKENRFLYSLLAGLIFLSLPYQVEAVTWMSGTSDLVSCCFVLSSLIFYFDFKNTAERKHLLLSVLFFLLAVLSKESSLFVPLLIIALEVFSIRSEKQAPAAIQTVAVYFIPVIIYAVLAKLMTGYFITPGIGIFTNMSLSLIIKNYFLYISKFFALYRLLPAGIRDILKIIGEHKNAAIIAIILFVALFYFLLIKRLNSKKPELRMIAFLIIAFIISLLPVIHLETSFVGSPQSDRYGYLPSVFFVILIEIIVMLVNRKGIAVTVLCAFMVWFYTEVQAQNGNWVGASHLVKKILNEFKPGEGDVYVTNVPDNFNGAYVLRNGLGDALSLVNAEDFEDKIKIISYQTITSEKDKANAEQISSSACRISFAKPGKTLPSSEKIFMLIPDTSRYSYSEISDTSFIVALKRTSLKDTFYYYSGGSLNAVH